MSVYLLSHKPTDIEVTTHSPRALPVVSASLQFTPELSSDHPISTCIYSTQKSCNILTNTCERTWYHLSSRVYHLPHPFPFIPHYHNPSSATPGLQLNFSHPSISPQLPQNIAPLLLSLFLKEHRCLPPAGELIVLPVSSFLSHLYPLYSMI